MDEGATNRSFKLEEPRAYALIIMSLYESLNSIRNVFEEEASLNVILVKSGDKKVPKLVSEWVDTVDT